LRRSLFKELVKSIVVLELPDVKRVADIARMKEHTGCEAVMIGRAAIGNPWIFSRLDREQVSPDMVRRMVRLHLERSLQFYGEHKGLVLFRKHATRYLSLQRLPRVRRAKIILQENPQLFLSMLDEAIEELR
jgi:tRNA-dihydrouridine synthase B